MLIKVKRQLCNLKCNINMLQNCIYIVISSDNILPILILRFLFLIVVITIIWYKASTAEGGVVTESEAVF